MQRSAGLRHVASIRIPQSVTARNNRNPFQCRRHASQLPPQSPSRPGDRSAKSSATSPSASQKSRKPGPVFWAVSSLFACTIGFYCFQLYLAANKPCPNPAVKDLAAQKDVSGQYDNTAGGFDSEVGLSETLMGINRTRKRLAQKCTGHVLEVSCGTGRNLGYFDIGKTGKVDSLTFVDLSPQMIEVCKKKWDALFGSKQDKLKSGLVVRFLPGSALGQMPLAPTSPARKYDAIIQTMGLCSTPSPVELLTNIVQYLDTSNPEARIYLLEHGRSYQDWMNNILDSSSEKHAEVHGCWYNRDIGALVEDAAKQTGMEVVNERRHHLGTTWVFELKPGPEAAKKVSSVTEKVAEQAKEKSRGWFGWSG